MEPVVPADREGLAGEAELVERLEQPVPARVAGEDTAGAVTAMGRGRESHDE